MQTYRTIAYTLLAVLFILLAGVALSQTLQSEDHNEPSAPSRQQDGRYEQRARPLPAIDTDAKVTLQPSDTSPWKTYRNSEARIEFKIPAYLDVTSERIGTASTTKTTSIAVAYLTFEGFKGAVQLFVTKNGNEAAAVDRLYSFELNKDGTAASVREAEDVTPFREASEVKPTRVSAYHFRDNNLEDEHYFFMAFPPAQAHGFEQDFLSIVKSFRNLAP